MIIGEIKFLFVIIIIIEERCYAFLYSEFLRNYRGSYETLDFTKDMDSLQKASATAQVYIKCTSHLQP